MVALAVHGLTALQIAGRPRANQLADQADFPTPIEGSDARAAGLRAAIASPQASYRSHCPLGATRQL